jgi:hypothetical protein
VYWQVREVGLLGREQPADKLRGHLDLGGWHRHGSPCRDLTQTRRMNQRERGLAV